MNLERARNLALQKLRRHSCPETDPEREAAELLAAATGLNRSDLLTRPELKLTPDQENRLRDWLERRLQHEPLERMTGRSSFSGLNLKLSPGTLIPRPATELLVQAVLRELRPNPPELIVDVGTGSGCIAIALAKSLPKETAVLATESSKEALRIAQENAVRNQTDDRIEFLSGDLLEPVAERLRRASSWSVVANLPYLPDDSGKGLPPEVRDFDPPSALFGGPDGLDPYRRLLGQTSEMNHAHCRSIFLEHLPEQLTQLRQELSDRFDNATVEPILSGDGPSATGIGLAVRFNN